MSSSKTANLCPVAENVGYMLSEVDSLKRELEQLRQQFDTELERQKLDALAEFSAGAGHEINNPLAIIGGHAQLLLQEIDHPEHRRQLAVILAQVKRAYEMIADIRAFARPPEPEIEEFDLITLLESFMEEQRPLMEQQNVQCQLQRDSVPEPSLLLRSDPTRLLALLACLCKNAREILRPTGGTVLLQLQRLSNRIEIAVQDNGPGVAEEIRPLIFCPYFSGRQAGRGLGFGLSKAWRTMQQLGGEIRYEPALPGPGARFVIQLPINKTSTDQQ